MTAVALTTALLLAPMTTTNGLEDTWRHDECRYESWNHHQGYQPGEVHKLLACLVDKFPVSGGLPKVHYIVDRESGYYCKADNPYSTASGLFQIVSGTWASWWASIHDRFRGWGLHPNVKLCRANAAVAVVAAHRWGWGPWGG